ncbi:MAG: SLBB domain-containing protein [Candidatus Krumholzibacteriia bacterium]
MSAIRMTSRRSHGAVPKSFPRPSPCLLPVFVLLTLLPLVFLGTPPTAAGQDLPPELLEEAMRRTGLGREELLRRYRAQMQGDPAETAGGDPAGAAGGAPDEPGRTALGDIDDSRPGGAGSAAARAVPPAASRPGGRSEESYWGGAPQVVLPGGGLDAGAVADDRQFLEDETAGQSPAVFGAEFFRLDAGMFEPPSFGPAPPDYLVGVGDEIVVDVWGEVEFRVTRVVDRDGTIILPRGGKIIAQNRTLEQLERAVREKLARSYSGISLDPGEGSIFLDVSLGSLRSIRVFVVGDARRPGSYELSSVSTIFSALYAAGGPARAGSMREIRLVRGQTEVGRLDLYDYLLGGRREGDVLLRDGDTVYIPPRGATVRTAGELRRTLLFELQPEEGYADLLRFAGGYTPAAALGNAHVLRIVPPEFRAPRAPDRVWVDISLDSASGLPADPTAGLLYDGDVVTVGAIEDRLENYVEIVGNVKRAGRYQHRPGMTVAALVAEAGGLWPDTLEERAVIDRTDSLGVYGQVSFRLGAVLRGEEPPLVLQPRDVLRVFSRWDVQERQQVHVSGEVRRPLSMDHREGLTLSDLILRAGGLKPAADPLRAEISRVRVEALTSRDTAGPAPSTVDVLTVPLTADYLEREDGFPLEPFDRVVVRKLPWWELQRTVSLQGEVFFPGTYSLERPDESLSSVIARAGGLKPTAYAPGARVIREQDGVGNIALNLIEALVEPGSAQDIILQQGDRIVIPDTQYTVKVVGEVGFPTSLVWRGGRDIDWYVERAGGYLENSDKSKARVIHPNGMSLPNKRNARVIAGSTIVVPVKPPREGPSRLEVVRDITVMLGSMATVWLAIDRAVD